MSFSKHTNNYPEHSLTQFKGAKSYSPGDKLLERLGASSSQAVFGSQSILTEELKQDELSMSQETECSIDNSHYESLRATEASMKRNGDSSSRSNVAMTFAVNSNADDSARQHETATSQTSPCHLQGLRRNMEQNDQEGWDSLLSAIDIKLLEQEQHGTHIDDQPYETEHEQSSSQQSCELLVLSYGASPTKYPAETSQSNLVPVAKTMTQCDTNVLQQSSSTMHGETLVKKGTMHALESALQVHPTISTSREVRNSQTKTAAKRNKSLAKRSIRHVLQDKSPNRATLRKDGADAETYLRRSTRRSLPFHETTTSNLLGPTNSFPTCEPLPPFETAKPQLGSNSRITRTKLVVAGAQDAALLSAVWPSGKYEPIATLSAPGDKHSSSAVFKGKRARPTEYPPAAVANRQQTKVSKRPKVKHQPKSIADVMEHILVDCPTATKEVYVRMVLGHAQPAKRKNPPAGVLDLSFQFNLYPPLEHIVLKNMARYYELSSNKNHFREQFAFNNLLCQHICQTAKDHKWIFPAEVTTKQIRDRVRCYYKTLIQNAKKRMATMLRDRTDAAMKQLKDLWKFIAKSPEVQEYLKLKRWNGKAWA
ncbi:hypothetical protein MPSEU_000443500 [Mayamaea pseudoterrestris]|nr:hypothetical protein MPSEU_000443500 [Mayamaea pseudoterrestris]